jgi:hypothetical protein
MQQHLETLEQNHAPGTDFGRILIDSGYDLNFIRGQLVGWLKAVDADIEDQDRFKQQAFEQIREEDLQRNEFVTAAISTNVNSFGLHQFVFISRNGEVWTALKNRAYALHEKGDLFCMDEDRATSLSKDSYECPEQQKDAPAAVVEEVWTTLANAG